MSRAVRSKRVRSQRFIRLQRWSLSVFVLVFLSWVGLVIVTHLERVAIQQIVIAAPTLDIQRVGEDVTGEVIKCSWLVCRDNYVFFPKKRVTHRLYHQWPRIADIAIDVDDPMKAVITLTEHKPQFIICEKSQISHDEASDEVERGLEEESEGEEKAAQETRCSYSNKFGGPYEEAPSISKGVYLTYNSPTLHHSDVYVRYHDFSQQLYDMYGIKVVSITFNKKDVELGLERWLQSYIEGASLLFDFEELASDEGMASALHRVDLALSKTDIMERIQLGEEQFQYLDLRFRDRFFMKFE